MLKADVGKHAEGEGLIDKAIAQMLGASAATVQMVRERFLRGRTRSRAGTLYARRVYKRSLDGRAEACLIALACSEAPRGRDRWSFRLLADKAVELGISGADIPSADNGAFSL